MPGWIGPWEIAILLIVALLVFGPKRLPEMGRSLGKGMRDFKKAVSSDDDDSVRKALSFDDDDEPVVHASTVTDAKTPREHDPVG